VYASSWWCAETAESYLRDRDTPIWESLERQRRGLYRQLVEVHFGDSEHLEEVFGEAGPFWGRHYVFWLGGQPLTVIYEVFSPALDEYLGQCCESHTSC